MKICIVIFVALCAIVAGSITEGVFDALTDASCEEKLAEYHAENADTLRELKRLERFVGGWGSTRP
jgi:hypothetical protein